MVLPHLTLRRLCCVTAQPGLDEHVLQETPELELAETLSLFLATVTNLGVLFVVSA